MRSTKNFLLSTALSATALLSVACNRQPEEVRTAGNDAPAATEAQPLAPQSVELTPEPRSVTVEEAAPAPSPSQADLDAKERELAERQADLEARERRLRDREETRPAPRPAPRTPAPAPAPRAPEPAPEVAGRDADVPDVDVETAPEPEERAEPLPEPEPEEALPEPVTVPSGTVLEVELLDTVSSGSSHVGDTFRARVSGDIRTGGRVAIPGGSEILGEVTEAVPLRKVGGQARLTLKFTDLVLPGGTTVPIDASFVQQGRSETGRDAATIGGAAAGGAILGRILNKGSRGRGSVIGAIIGAAAGTVIASRTPGEEVNLFEGSVVDLQLNGPVRIRPRR
jgi:type IV secretory pathway VirB10-like protein